MNFIPEEKLQPYNMKSFVHLSLLPKIFWLAYKFRIPTLSMHILLGTPFICLNSDAVISWASYCDSFLVFLSIS